MPENVVFALKVEPAIAIPVGAADTSFNGAIVVGAGAGAGAGAGDGDQGSGAGVGVGAGGTYAAAIEIARVSEAVIPFAPVTVIVIVEVPAAVGVPLTSPVLGSKISPAGSVPFVKVNDLGDWPPVETGTIE